MNWMMKAAAAAVLCLILAGCSGAGEQSPTPTLAATQTAVPTVQPSATPIPTATALPGRLVLLSPPGAQNVALEKVLLAEAQKAGLILDKREALQASDLDVSARVVVALSQPPNLAELQAAAPQAQFLVVSPDALEPNDHLSVLRTQPEQLAFAAGFTAAMLSADWRTAAVR